MSQIDSLNRSELEPLTEVLYTPAAAERQLPDAVRALRPVALEIEARPSRVSGWREAWLVQALA